MFTEGMNVMLYVDNVEINAAFWLSLGFTEFDRQEMDGTLIVELGMTAEAKTHLVLYDRKFIEKHSPEVGMNSPSIMFEASEILSLYQTMQTKQVVVGDMVQMGKDYVFNFADPDGNYFAIRGKE